MKKTLIISAIALAIALPAGAREELEPHDLPPDIAHPQDPSHPVKPAEPPAAVPADILRPANDDNETEERETLESSEQQTTDSEVEKATTDGDEEDNELLESDSVSSKWQKYVKKGQQQFSKSKFSAAASSFKKALSSAKKSEDNDRLMAVTYKWLGKSSLGREKFRDADDYLKQASQLYEKLGKRSSQLTSAVAELAKKYATLDFTQFGEKATEYLNDAGVSRIVLFRKPEVDHIEIELKGRLVRETESDKVKKVAVEKLLTFDFQRLPDNKFSLKNIKGLTVRTTKVWVTLISSILGLDEQKVPIAQVTGQKLGKKKTVNIKVPDKIYDQAITVLDKIKKAIDDAGSSKQDSSQTEASSGEENQQSSASPAAQPASPADPYDPLNRLTKPFHNRNRNTHPPDVIDGAAPRTAPTTIKQPSPPVVAPDRSHEEFSEIIEPIKKQKPAVITPKP